MQHINSANNYQLKQGAQFDAINLRLRKTIHGGVLIKINESYHIAFKGNLQWQEPHWQSVMGLYFQFLQVNFGVAARLARNYPNAVFPPVVDAGILSFSYAVNQLKFGLSFDLNVSPLYRATNYRGAMEFTTSYLFGRNNRCVDCPNF